MLGANEFGGVQGAIADSGFVASETKSAGE
jgi:hypothetical protein